VLQIVSFGEQPIAPNLVVGEIVAIHVDEAILDPSGRVDPRKLKTIARLGGDWYCRTSDLFAMKRPQ
jgi:flavin reductase (DIM6/NTAB) family NADH-FMN oxidoreductase RutF